MPYSSSDKYGPPSKWSPRNKITSGWNGSITDWKDLLMFRSVKNSTACSATELAGRPREVLSISCKGEPFRRKQHIPENILYTMSYCGFIGTITSIGREADLWISNDGNLHMVILRIKWNMMIRYSKC